MTPKADFLLTPAAKVHYDLTGTEVFKQAMNAALLQVVAETAVQREPDPGQAAARYNEIAGAVKFYKTLMNLGTKSEPQPTKNVGNLDHKTK